ncbi:hypothetical protein R1flu_002437 [Riccia fluitans]|uniref:ADP-ribosylhydrolase ARH3 n=1 Tax=Riccia fluitans TaxID=41844 RepID=A0ABD1Y9G3_9MARC
MKRSSFLGCLLAGACGDALGAKVEFIGRSVSIFRKYGPRGIRDIGMNYDVFGGVTDDTQMTLFTAEGLISAFLPLLVGERSEVSESLFQPEDTVPSLHQSYLRWLKTQGVRSNSPAYKNEVVDRGWLIQQKSLFARRAPGNTCLRALMSGAVGSTHNLINNSKGCGGVMRVAPCALLVAAGFPDLPKDQKLHLAFKLGCSAAAVTHTHPSGWLSSGCLASIILSILSGECLEKSVEETIVLLEKEPKHKECLQKIEQAVRLATLLHKKSVEFSEGSVEKQELALEHIEMIGEGWVGEEALGIALYCCLISPNDIETAVCYAVNHGGDSDSTGAIAGNILGALLGSEAIPSRWTEAVELRDIIQKVSDDLFDVLDPQKQQELTLRYPPAVLTTNNGTDLKPYYQAQFGLHERSVL